MSPSTEAVNPKQTSSPESAAVVDPKRCVSGGTSEEYRNTGWVAVTGTRADVNDDAAKKLATNYWLNGRRGGIERVYGPFADGPEVKAPSDPTAPPNKVVDADSYLQRAARANTSARPDQFVCFYLIRVQE